MRSISSGRPGQNPQGTVADSAGNDLIFHGGNAGAGAIGVETKPAVYLVWWGQEWADTASRPRIPTATLFSSKTLQNYLGSFFTNLGGSPWAGVQTQYCNGVLIGAMSCVGGTGFVTNPKHQLKGVWTDPTPVPSDIVALGLAENLVNDPIAAEAQRASAHFGYDPQATYIILTPPRTIATGEPVYCGYHSQTSSVNGLGNPYRLQYAFIPWQNQNWPGLGAADCGMHNVNATSDAFGNGIFDGWSIVTGHEYAEAVTDPDNFATWQDGWLDAQGSENGDKCAWLDDAEHHARLAPVRRAADVEQRGVRRDRQRLRRHALGRFVGGRPSDGRPPRSTDLQGSTVGVRDRAPHDRLRP